MISDKERIASLEQWRTDIIPRIDKLIVKVESHGHKLAVATGIIIAVQFLVPLVYPAIAKAFNAFF
jgi:hypothetical protein